MSESQKVRKALYMVLSVVIAAGIWFYVDESSGQTVTQEVTGIPIEYTGQSALADNGLMLVEGEDSGTSTSLDITYKGKRRHIVRMDRSKVRVTVDLSGITAAGIQKVKLNTSFTDRTFNSGNTSVYEQSLDMATVNICELSHKEVELRCELTGNVAEGYSAGKVQLSQTAIQIRGQESDIAPVSYAKVVFDIGRNARESITATLEYQFYDENGQVIKNKAIHTEERQIQATLPVYVTKELKLAVDFQEAPGALLEDMIYEIKPGSIWVSGDASILNSMDRIVLDSFDLLTVTQESASHSYAILVPDGCENLSGVTRATLEIGYPDRTVMDVITENIHIENAPESREVELLTTQMAVRVFGTAAEVEQVTGDKIHVTVDLSDYAVASGTYMVSARVRLDEDISVGVAGTYQAQVRIPEVREEPDTPEEELGETQ